MGIAFYQIRHGLFPIPKIVHKEERGIAIFPNAAFTLMISSSLPGFYSFDTVRQIADRRKATILKTLIWFLKAKIPAGRALFPTINL